MLKIIQSLNRSFRAKIERHRDRAWERRMERLEHLFDNIENETLIEKVLYLLFPFWYKKKTKLEKAFSLYGKALRKDHKRLLRFEKRVHKYIQNKSHDRTTERRREEIKKTSQKD